MDRRAMILCAAVLAAAALSVAAVAQDSAPAPSAGPSVDVKLKMTDVHHVTLQRMADGSYRYVVTDDEGVHALSPQQFAQRLYDQQTQRSFLHRLFNITSPIGIAWVMLGFLGQALFTGRMIVQWLISEKQRRSVVPVAFWWMSLGGGLMLLTYFAWRKDIVGVVGQSTGVFIYTRNLILIARRRRQLAAYRASRAAEARPA